MFVQVIEGHTSDADGLRRQFERWEADLRPGAAGFLGSTGGVDAAGRVVLLARFESAAAARANSDRSEQGDWWTETEKYFDSDVTFADSEDIETVLGGGSNDAGFVQIMKGSGDRAQIKELDAVFEEHAPSFRPDVLGGLRAWTGPTTYVEAVYFTSEEAARAGESSEPPPALAERMGDYESAMSGVEYTDLSNPWLH